MINNDNHVSLSTRRHWQFTVSAEGDGLRLDQALPLQCTGLSRTQARKLIDIGGVHVTGRRVRSCSRNVKSGDEIAVYCDGLPLDPFVLTDADILYRDEDIIALNKPAGIETQPTPARYQGTLYAALSLYLTNPFRPQAQPSIGMVQRLDRDTSGVILFSISQRAHKPLTAAIAGRELQKTYLALASGSIPDGEREIRTSLARCHRDNCVRSVAKGGKEAITLYRRVSSHELCSLVEVNPTTGRMHQIRAHLSEAGFPLLGDRRYNGPVQLDDTSIDRHMLHALSLELWHPITRQTLKISAPLPADFQRIIDRFDLDTMRKEESF